MTSSNVPLPPTVGGENPKVTKAGIVQKIIKSAIPHVPEQAEIAVEGADTLYREIRIDNALEDGDGDKVKLKVGSQVDVTFEADASDTAPAI